MRVLIIATVVLASGVANAAAGPYAGEQARAIKTLSPAEVHSYLTGEGLGYAKAGELNHYPGPRHVLDLTTQLELTANQRAQTEMVFVRMHGAAVPLGRKIVAAEQQLNAGFANGSMNDSSVAKETAAIAALEGRLRAVHLSAHLAMRRILTAAQTRRYDRLRGYMGGHSAMHRMNM